MWEDILRRRMKHKRERDMFIRMIVAADNTTLNLKAVRDAMGGKIG